ncbi:hypothetical protein [Ottowia thiooxydans]|nr:hypothetical protein [Ottowia thiooxydans]
MLVNSNQAEPTTPFVDSNIMAWMRVPGLCTSLIDARYYFGM